MSTNAIDNPYVSIMYSIGDHNSDNDRVIKLFASGYNDDTLHDYAIKFGLFIRDIIDGCGNRTIGRILLEKLFDLIANDDRLTTARKASMINAIVAKIVYDRIGRWDDIIEIVHITNNDVVKSLLVDIVVNQLKTDIVCANNNESVSLLGKWLPSINGSNKARKRAFFWEKILKVNHRQYRQLLARLRRVIDIVEGKITANQWSTINYSTVPSLAMVKYRNAFNKHDHDRYNAYIDDVSTNNAKLNATTTDGYKIVWSIIKHFNEIGDKFTADEYKQYDALWNSRRHIDFTFPIIPIADVSGSMTARDRNNVVPLSVSVAIAIELARGNPQPYRDLLIEFSNESSVIDISKYDHIVDIVNKLVNDNPNYGLSTNLSAAFNNILNIAVKSGVTSVPAIAIITDGEFNELDIDGDDAYDSNVTLFDYWREKYRRAGVEFPKVILWNIGNRTRTVGDVRDDGNLLTVGGFSSNTLTMLTSGNFDSWEALKAQLDSRRYEIS